MTLRYEINPPKVSDSISDEESLELLNQVKQRVSEISSNCNGIHLTDSVLGTHRVSPIAVGAAIRKSNQKIKITASLRVRDKGLSVLEQLMDDAISGGLNGILVLKGDPSKNEKSNSGIIPSQTAKHFKELGFDKKIEIFLSLPSNPDFKKIQKKIDAKPTGFVTQVIHSVEEVSRIADELKPQGFKIIPCILMPFEKNKKSAEFLKLDWSGYQENVLEFIKNVHDITGEVLITSPNDFKGAQETLSKLAI